MNPSRQLAQAQPLTPEQIATQIRLARQFFARTGYVAGGNLPSDFTDLNLFLPEEKEEIIESTLSEIAPEYCNGPHPPNHLAGEPKASGLRMVQFAWPSNCFDKKRMYLKFCLSPESRLILLRLHVDHEPNRYKG